MTSPLSFLWAGLVLGVSFLATPVKFRAPLLTRPIALDVGRTTFHALVKVESLWAMTLIANAAIQGEQLATWILVACATAILALQTMALLPRLDVRVAAIIDGAILEPSRLHTVYAGSEAAKCAALITAGFVAS